MKKILSQMYSSFQKNKDEFHVYPDFWDDITANLQPIEAFNLFATELARLYEKRILDYEFCDFLINEAWSEWMFTFLEQNENTIPVDFYEVYEAFDAGEYYRTKDKSDDPVADHTNPQIKQFLERISKL